jgi:hypothetical protein
MLRCNLRWPQILILKEACRGGEAPRDANSGRDATPTRQGQADRDARLRGWSARAMHSNDTAWPRNHRAVRHITVTVRVFPTTNPVRNRASFDRMTT